MLEEAVIVFFRALSNQLYGNPNNHFYVRSLSFHKINTKLLQRTYFTLLLSDANRSFLPTSLNSPLEQTVKFICS